MKQRVVMKTQTRILLDENILMARWIMNFVAFNEPCWELAAISCYNNSTKIIS